MDLGPDQTMRDNGSGGGFTKMGAMARMEILHFPRMPGPGRVTVDAATGSR